MLHILRSWSRSVIPIVFVVSACGGQKPSPVAPSDPSPSTPAPAPSGSAVINGVVKSAGSSTVAGMQVRIVDTPLTTAVDASGGFMLSGVPSGPQQLRFSAPGVDASLPIADIRQGETIAVSVMVSGNTASVESQSRSSSGELEVEGRVESLPPTQPANTFVVASRTVRTTSATEFRDGGAARTFSDLKIGMRVHVKGTADGTAVVATRVELQNSNVTIPVELHGIVAALAGNAAAFQFTVDGRLVKGDSATEFDGDGGRTTFADLANGVRVEVKGQQRDAFVYAERLHVHKPDNDDDDDEDPKEPEDQQAWVDGILTSIAGQNPALTLIVAGATVKTTANTQVKRRGNVQPLDALKVNQRLEVEGTRNADGSITARKIEIEDEPEEEEKEVEVEGTMGGLQGTCPNLTFGVNGVSIATSGSTEFKDAACSAFKNGDKVRAKGTRRADGGVNAKRLEKRK